MSGQRSSTGLRAFWVLLCVALVGLAVAGVVAIASGGYHPPTDSVGLDPVRTGMLVFLVAGTAAFALLAAGGIMARRASEPTDLGALVFVVGLTIATAAMVPIMAILPAEPGHTPVPFVLRAPLYVGLGLMALAFVSWIAGSARDAIRERDPARLVALVVFAGLIAFIMFRR